MVLYIRIFIIKQKYSGRTLLAIYFVLWKIWKRKVQRKRFWMLPLNN